MKEVNGILTFESNVELKEWFDAHSDVKGWCELFLRCNVSGGMNGTRKTARTLKDANGKPVRFETLFPMGVFHTYQLSVNIHADYGDGVNARIEAKGILPEGTVPVFEPDPLPWGEWYIFDLLITHNGGWYLRYYPRKGGFRTLSEAYVDYDGNVIDPATWDIFVKEFKEITKTSDKQASFGLAPVDQLKCRTCKFDSIQRIHLGGVQIMRVGKNPLGIGG